MKHTKLKNIQPSQIGSTLTVCGWVRTVREQKTFAFVELNDGSTFSNLQIVVDQLELLKNISTGASIAATGELVQSPGQKQKWELKASSIHVFGTCPEEYPLQKKRHSFEFLRTIAHFDLARTHKALSPASAMPLALRPTYSFKSKDSSISIRLSSPHRIAKALASNSS